MLLIEYSGCIKPNKGDYLVNECLFYRIMVIFDRLICICSEFTVKYLNGS